jgi:REP element-mobilizing transposase RayT
VPDFLFFGPEQEVNLSEDYGDRKYAKVRVRGLIDTLNRYKFTIEENTPFDQEVALDPELCGKVFENLLAAYNPETGTTARKATGSFYTPREIVDYMVDESLVAYLKGKLEGGTGIPACAHGDTGIPAGGDARTKMSVSPSPLTITRRNLPHWTRDGAIYWVTFRLADSLPQEKLHAWTEERGIWIGTHPEPWSESDWQEYDERFGKRLDEWLDAGYGSRALARPDVREAVRDCLMRFDGERLRVHAAVIMPTHVHALLEPLANHSLSELLKGMKGASARHANQLLGATGMFWLDESYDHIVRSQRQYAHFVRYIAENPRKAGLSSNEYWLLQGDTDIPVCGRQDAQAGMPVPPSAEERLRTLLAYEGEPHGFTDAETEALIDAIDNLKALDPAVGSGAFPMGILHKLVHVLGKLDPDNEKWKAKQIAKLDDAVMREEAERVFRENYDNYGRKLYLIENCIYGVDIQPIAVQIAKMRFFISLIVDQKCDTGIPACAPQGGAGIPACGNAQTGMSVLPNRGVRALPNLETKFVAANTLIGIEKPKQMLLRNPDIDRKEAELRKVREQHFTAKTPKAKARCRELDKKLRAEIADLLKNDGWDNATAKQLAAWDPYDQNASSPFFDPEWLFGVREGFDVVIGNPPYLFGEHLADQKNVYRDRFEVASGQFDAYWLFYERSLSGLLRERGTHCFINSDAMLARDESAGFRKWLLQNAGFLMMSHVGQVFGGVGVSAVVVLVLKGSGPLLTYTVVPYDEGARIFGEASSLSMSEVAEDPKTRLRCLEVGGASWEFLSHQPACFADFFAISRGEELGKKYLSRLEANSAPRGCVPVLAGEGVARFSPPRPTHFVSKSMIVKSRSNYDSPKIVIVKTGASFVAAVDDDSLITLQSVYNLRPKGAVPCKLGCALLNSRLLNAYLRWKVTGQKKLFPQITQGNVLEMPVPDVPMEKQRAIVDLVDRILAAKAADPGADTAAWEREIDERVYRLYGLTEEEVKIVEESAR